MTLNENDLCWCEMCNAQHGPSRAFYGPGVEMCPEHNHKLLDVSVMAGVTAKDTATVKWSILGIAVFVIAIDLIAGWGGQPSLIVGVIAAMTLLFVTKGGRFSKAIRTQAEDYLKQWAKEREEVLKTASDMLDSSNPQGTLEILEKVRSRGFSDPELDALYDRSLNELDRLEG